MNTQTKQGIARFTTNIRRDLFDFMSQETHQKNIKRRTYLEDLIERSLKQARRDALLEGFRKMAEDQEERRERLRIANSPHNLQQLANFDKE